jgi:hypothetical protein
MKKLLVCLGLYLSIALPYKAVSADETKPAVDEARVEAFINKVYKGLDFTGHDRLSYYVFEKAYRGYLNLRNAGKLNTDKEILSVCDFNLPSTEDRLWIIDLATGKVLFNTYVAHGQGSGEDCAESFSNNFNSHQSSLGFYVTTNTYCGEHGISLRLLGVDQGFNDAALDRGIVVHGADYVSDKFISGNERLGRSWGCPAVPDQLKLPIINAIEGGTCLFIFHNDNKYQKTAYWLNKKIDHLPEMSMYDAIAMPQAKPKCTKYVIEYMHGNKVDSVKTIPAAE